MSLKRKRKKEKKALIGEYGWQDYYSLLPGYYLPLDQFVPIC